MMGCTSHAAQRRTLISGLKIGALLINQWRSGGQQELCLSPRGRSHAGLWAFAVLERQAFISHWKSETDDRDRCCRWVCKQPKRFVKAAGTMINDRQRDNTPTTIITHHKHVIMRPHWLAVWHDILKAHPLWPWCLRQKIYIFLLLQSMDPLK